MTKHGGTATPTRTCVGCGTRDRQSAMLRLRRDGGERIAAAAAIRSGRSAYVHASQECIRGLARSKVLGKSLRHNVAKDVRQELIESLEAQVKSGQVPLLRAASCSGSGD